MKIIQVTTMLGLCAALMGAAPPAQKAAPAQKGVDPKAVMAAMQQYATPGPEHQRLKMLEGSWDVGITLYAQGQALPESKGRADFWLILGDRFVVEELKGQFLDQPVNSHIVFGYDNAKKKYVSMRITSLGTDMMVREGTADASGKVITLTGEAFDAQTGKSATGRMVYTFESNDKFTVSVYETKPGAAEVKLFDMVYTRRAA
ncbi:MAG: DUF1579 domain-containing protein [Myxococcota bacterium]